MEAKAPETNDANGAKEDSVGVNTDLGRRVLGGFTYLKPLMCEVRVIRRIFAASLVSAVVLWSSVLLLGETPRQLFAIGTGTVSYRNKEVILVQVKDEKISLDDDLPLSYAILQDGLVKLGREMNVSRVLLKKIGLPQTSFMELTEDNVDQLIFVTAASSNHFKECLVAISRIQAFMPQSKILYYDLGLTPEQVKEAKTWCNVEYRQFDFSIFPPHVSDLRLYSWKPLIIQEVFREFPQTGMVWMDASFRLQTNDLSIIFEKVLQRGGGVFTFNHCSHSVYAATHPQMYEYLPADIESLKPLNMQGANSMFVYPTKRIYNGWLYWWYLCALDESCQAPPNITRPCPLIYPSDGDRRNIYYAYCHRFDQSAMNVLLGNLFAYDGSRYTIRNPASLVKVERKRDMGNFTMKTCSN